MTKNKTICLITEDNELKEKVKLLLSAKYNLLCFNSIEDFTLKQQATAEGNQQPQLFIFDEISGKKCFYEDRNVVIDSSQVVILGEDNLEYMRLFYSIGLNHFLLKSYFHNQLQVKIEFMLGELIAFTKWNLEEVKWQELTFKERKILKILCHNPEQILDRKEIIKFVWRNDKVQSRTFDVHLHNLRKKLEKYGYEIITHGQGKYQILLQTAQSA